jgi:ABC-type glycerol-3-phosphate transport system substrate-binding protein
MLVAVYVVLTLLIMACKKNNAVIGSEGFKSLSRIDITPVNFVGHWLGEGKKETLIKELVNEFEFMNQDINVVMKFPEDLYFDRRIANAEFIFNAKMVMQEKPEWDIIRFNNERGKVADILKDPEWTKKYLVDFSEIPEFTKYTRPELLSDTVKSFYGGIIPGPFIDGYLWTLWCNTEVARKIGIEVKQFDMTFDDFIGYIKALYEYNKSHNANIIGIYESNNWMTTHTLADQLFFSEIGNFDELSNYKYSDKKLKAWDKVLHEMERLSPYKPVSSDWSKTTWTETVNYPIEGKCLFYLNGSWMYNIWLKNDSIRTQDMMPVELPVLKPAPACFGGFFVTWAVLKHAPHRDQAVRLLLSLNRPDVAEKWSRQTKSPTGVKGELSSAVFGFDKFENFRYMIEKKYGQHKMHVFNNSNFCFGRENERISNYADSVLLAGCPADEAMKIIKRQLRKK